MTASLETRLAGWLPIFARIYHIPPSQFWDLTCDEFGLFIADMESMIETEEVTGAG